LHDHDIVVALYYGAFHLWNSLYRLKNQNLLPLNNQSSFASYRIWGCFVLFDSILSATSSPVLISVANQTVRTCFNKRTSKNRLFLEMQLRKLRIFTWKLIWQSKDFDQNSKISSLRWNLYSVWHINCAFKPSFEELWSDNNE